MKLGDYVPPMRRVWPPEAYRAIIVHQYEDEVRVVFAPEFSRINLELIAAADPDLLRVGDGVITLAGVVDYRVIGWEAPGLVVQLEEDRRGG